MLYQKLRTDIKEDLAFSSELKAFTYSYIEVKSYTNRMDAS